MFALTSDGGDGISLKPNVHRAGRSTGNLKS
jgi:hypothetical protein